jgi:hypothetical protein
MTTLSSLSVSVLALVVGCGIAAAQATGAQPPDGGEDRPRPRPPIDTALDVNGDEIIDAGEIANAVAAVTKLDTNGDGQLTPDEYRPPRPGGRAAGQAKGDGAAAWQSGQGATGAGTGRGTPPQGGARPRPPIVRALDANGDGEIDAGELANADKALRALDADGDGTLSPNEYRPPRPDGPGAQNPTGDTRGTSPLPKG